MSEIKPCPFCGSDDLHMQGNKSNYVYCENCDTYGPDGEDEEEAIRLWNHAPRIEEEPKMEKCCQNCVHISKEVDGKVYCSETVNEIYGCNYYEPKNPFAYDFRICRHCKHSYGYQVAGTDTIVLRCGRNIGRSKEYVCDKWEAKEPKSTPLTPSNSKGLDVTPSENLKYIYQTEPFENRVQQLAEEAAELAQAALKYNRSLGNGCYTPVSLKDAADSLTEEMADVLLCMAAAFPYTERYKDFHVNLERIYKEKETRWTERLKENTKEE